MNTMYRPPRILFLFLCCLIPCATLAACHEAKEKPPTDPQAGIQKLSSRAESLEKDLGDCRTQLQVAKFRNPSVEECEKRAGNIRHHSEKKLSEKDAQLDSFRVLAMDGPHEKDPANERLKEFWPLIVKKMPGWYKLWHDVLPGLNPDYLAYTSYEPQIWKGTDEDKRRDQDYMERPDCHKDLDFEPGCIISPDGNLCVALYYWPWTDDPTEERDVDNDTYLINKQNKCKYRLTAYGPSVALQEAAWIDQRTFIIVFRNFPSSHLQYVHSLRFYKVKDNGEPDFIGSLQMPVISPASVDAEGYLNYLKDYRARKGFHSPQKGR